MCITQTNIFYRIKRYIASTCSKSLLHGDFVSLLKIIFMGNRKQITPVWTKMHYLPLAHHVDKSKGNNFPVTLSILFKNKNKSKKPSDVMINTEQEIVS